MYKILPILLFVFGFLSSDDNLTEVSNNDVFIVSREGDRLDNLAHKYYSDNTLWWVIAKANGIKGKTALKPGENLRITLNIQRITENFRNINKSG